MQINGTRFGSFEYEAADIVRIPKGLIGFPEAQNFVVVNHKPESAFRWLQCIEDASLAFLVAFPVSYFPNYEPNLKPLHRSEIGLGGEDSTLIFATASIPKGKPSEATLNLAGPIVINPQTQLGIQVILDDQAYTVRHRIFDPIALTPELAA